VVDAAALTVGAGTHPLFEGVSRVEFAGLEEPEISESEGRVTLRTSTLTVEFAAATVDRSERRITLRLGG
jgi:hypothetical protein